MDEISEQIILPRITYMMGTVAFDPTHVKIVHTICNMKYTVAIFS